MMEHNWIMNRVLAAGSGACSLSAVQALGDGRWQSAAVGFILMAFCALLCAPWAVVLGLGKVSSTVLDSDKLTSALRTLQPTPAGLPPMQSPMFGTPVIWCGLTSLHNAHAWHISGPEYDAVFCMGHACENPKGHALS